jgi:hypothetical protein
MTRALFLFGVLGTGLMAAACASNAKGNWTLDSTKVSVSGDNRVVVDAVFANHGDAEWGGSRCVDIDWEKGGVQSRDDVRAQKPPTSPVEVIETQRYCNGGNHALGEGDRDSFHIISNHFRDQLAGSTIVVVAEDFKGTSDDDRVTIASP